MRRSLSAWWRTLLALSTLTSCSPVRPSVAPTALVQPAATPTSLQPATSSFGGFGGLGPAVDLGSARRQQMLIRQKAIEAYVSSVDDLTGHVVRFQLVFDTNPLSRGGAEHLTEVEESLRKALPEEMLQDAEIHFVGAPASIRDLIVVTGRDQTRIKVLVVSCVFVILLALFWR